MFIVTAQDWTFLPGVSTHQWLFIEKMCFYWNENFVMLGCHTPELLPFTNSVYETPAEMYAAHEKQKMKVNSLEGVVFMSKLINESFIH